MANITDIDSAKAIVQQFYKAAADPALEDLLESSKSPNKGYRPYFVAAYFMYTEYRRIIKADEVTFAYDLKFTIEGLLNTQKAKDCNDTSIDECWQVGTILDPLTGETFTSPSAFVL